MVHKSKAPRRVLACGVRWGKSTCAAMETIAALFEPREETLGWIVGPTYESSKRIFGEVVRTVHTYLPHRVEEFVPREHRLVVINFAGGRSVLRGKSSDNTTSLLSEAIDFCVVDEAARMREDVWTQHLAQRLIDRGGWSLLLSTPRGRNWFHQLFKRGQRGRDAGFESWSQPSWMNPHVSRALIEEERPRMTQDGFAQEFEGSFGDQSSDPCDRCGYPSRTAACVVILEGQDDTFARCIDCGRPCHANGATACMPGVDGKPTTTVIELCKRRVEVPPMPGTERDYREVRITGVEIPTD